MDLPNQLKSAIEQKAAEYPMSELVRAAENISVRYRNESGQGKHLVRSETDTVTYAAVRMPATFGAIYSAVRSLPDPLRESIRTVLDVGAGTGTAAWAISSAIETAENITCVEREPAMIRFAKDLMADTDLEQKVRWIHADMRSFVPTEKYDLVIASYSLNELSAEDRAAVIQKLWKSTDKFLLIIEPGTPVAFEQLRQARSTLTAQGASVIAPCPHNDPCPLKEDDWCHFTCRVARSKLHKLLKGGSVPYEDEKFSYLAVSKEPFPAEGSRILRHPLVESGKITLQLCTPDSTETRIVTKKNKELFRIARKSVCGDLFPFSS